MVMIEMRIQIEHKGYLHTDTLAKVLKDYIDASPEIENNFSVEDIQEWISRERWFALTNRNFVSTFLFSFEPFADISIVQDIFYGKSSYLQDVSELKDWDGTKNVLNILKLSDSSQFEKGQNYRSEIYQIEMSLRQITHYILTYNNRNIKLSDIFKDFNITFWKEGWKEASAKQHFENELYHIPFGDYVKFEEPKQIEDKQLLKVLYTSTTFEEFRGYLGNRLLGEERHRAFFSSIKQDMDAIERMRNIIAHNRSIDTDIEEDYKKSRDKLNNQIVLFWNDESLQFAQQMSMSEDYKFIWEAPAKRKIEEILQNSTTWDIEQEYVEIYNYDNVDTTLYEDLESLQIALELIAEEEAELYMPTDEELKIAVMETFNSEKLVLQCLEPYRDKIEEMGWAI